MGLNLTFKTVKGAVFHLDFPPETKVEEVKRKIEETQGESMPAADLVVISQGKILLDETSLADNNITESGFLVVMVKPKAKEKKADTVTAPTQSPPAATASAQAPQPSQSASVSAPSADPQNVGPSELLVGANLEARIAQIVDMGFPRDQVIAALKAAFNNSERAVEYLMTGIPESRRGGLDEDAPAPAPAPAVLPAAAPPQTAVPVPPGPNAQPLDMFASQGAPVPGGALDALRSNPQFQTLRQLVQQQPGILEPMLQELARQNPRLVAQINDNQAEFLQLLNEPGAAGVSELASELASQFGGGANEAPQGATIVLSTEDAAAIERLQQLGFERSVCIEAYIACDKDEQLAANYLFDSGNDM